MFSIICGSLESSEKLTKWLLRISRIKQISLPGENNTQKMRDAEKRFDFFYLFSDKAVVCLYHQSVAVFKARIISAKAFFELPCVAVATIILEAFSSSSSDDGGPATKTSFKNITNSVSNS